MNPKPLMKPVATCGLQIYTHHLMVGVGLPCTMHVSTTLSPSLTILSTSGWRHTGGLTSAERTGTSSMITCFLVFTPEDTLIGGGGGSGMAFISGLGGG